MGRRATPGARKLAKDLGIDLETVKGSGKSGYIVNDDVYVAHVALAASRPNGQPEQGPPFTHEMKEDYDGTVYPVSELYKMRFRQDDPVTGDMAGEDLLAIRPKAAGGKFRSHDGVLGFFVADRGFFTDSVKIKKPVKKEPQIKAQPTVPETTDGESFAVSE